MSHAQGPSQPGPAPPCETPGLGGPVRWRAAAPSPRAVGSGRMGWGAVGARSPPLRAGQPERRGRRVGKSFRGGGHGSPPQAAPPGRERSPGPRRRTESFPHPGAGPPAGLGRRRGARSPRGARAAHFAPGFVRHGRGSPARTSRTPGPPPAPAFCVCAWRRNY